MRQRVRAALDELSPSLREVLVLRFLEQLPVRDAAAVMRITEGAFKTRQVRALQQLRRLLKHDVDE